MLSELDRRADATVVDCLGAIGQLMMDVDIPDKLGTLNSPDKSIATCVGESLEVLPLASSDAT